MSPEIALDTRGNIYFAGGMVGLESINKGIVVCSPIRGDNNRDRVVGLDDAISVMQILTGVSSGIQAFPANANGDGKPDIPEAIYVLQSVARSSH